VRFYLSIPGRIVDAADEERTGRLSRCYAHEQEEERKAETGFAGAARHSIVKYS
jgi:hypothetical protein